MARNKGDDMRMRELIEKAEENFMHDINESVADTILQQMGGARRLSAMIGAKDFFSDDGGKSLVFKFPNKQKSGPNYVKITLNGKDLYDVTFSRYGTEKEELDPEETAMYKKFGIKPKGKMYTKVVKEYNDIFADQLVDIFEKTTGLYLRL